MKVPTSLRYLPVPLGTGRAGRGGTQGDPRGPKAPGGAAPRSSSFRRPSTPAPRRNGGRFCTGRLSEPAGPELRPGMGSGRAGITRQQGKRQQATARPAAQVHAGCWGGLSKNTAAESALSFPARLLKEKPGSSRASLEQTSTHSPRAQLSGAPRSHLSASAFSAEFQQQTPTQPYPCRGKRMTQLHEASLTA